MIMLRVGRYDASPSAAETVTQVPKMFGDLSQVFRFRSVLEIKVFRATVG
jgi:hypothetical protein